VNVETIYNPVDVSKVRALASEDIDHQWLMEKNKKVVVSVGRLAKQKNFPLLLKAFSRAVEHVDACLIILGEGSERARLEQLVDELGLAGRVDLPGYKKNVQPYVARSDLFVLSSDFEGMPNALLEAVAVGVPVVSTDCLSGPAEILQQGEGGLLVPVGDAGALSDAIVNELKDVSGAISRQRLAADKLGEFEYQRIMQKYEDLLKKVAYA
jgi:glycosyltransferase involved in cell wall biosynthesis